MILFVIILLQLSCLQTFYLPREFQSDVNDTAEEIQHAICRISTKELEASANATITRQLRGVCTANDLDQKLHELEIKILEEIDSLKQILQPKRLETQETKLKSSYSGDVLVPKYSSSERPSTLSLNRNDEIALYNDTLNDSNEGSVYFYYWNIPDVRELLKKEEMYISSPDFYILGHSLRLQFYPNHLEKYYFGIQLRPASKGFLKKHKIILLNGINKRLDLDSGILYGLRMEDSIFRISQNVISRRGFIDNNSLTIKLEVYLNL